MISSQCLNAHILVEEFIRELDECSLDYDASPVELVSHTANDKLITSTFFSGACERYYFDFNLDLQKGWRQYDTSSDAWYFGIWVNLSTLQIIEFAEGDIVLRTYLNKEDMKNALAKMNQHYGSPPPAFTTISDDGTICHHYEERPSI